MLGTDVARDLPREVDCELMYVYLLSDPRCNCIRYVGITANIYQRYRQHCAGASGSKAMRKWITWLRCDGERPACHVVARLPWRQAGRAERDWINTLRIATGHTLLNYGPGLGEFVARSRLNWQAYSLKHPHRVWGGAKQTA